MSGARDSLLACPDCGGLGEVPATPGQPGDGPEPCPRCRMRSLPPSAYPASLCAHSEFECDCDCKCQQGKDTTECRWPDCGCGCDVACVGCRLVRERADA